ncbi:MAG TPA: hypothetical protein VI522_00990 [Gammaproteobacteria bacterium]|nr:hypothetical protein [Gammaproteobacteria bacterium]
MSIPIKQMIIMWLQQHPKTRQWLWFIGLWLAGLLTVVALSYPIKILFKNLA